MLIPHVSPGPAPRLLRQLPGEHLLRDRIQEREQLLARLDELDLLIEEYRDAVLTPGGREIPARIRNVADDLVHAEPHHQREERILGGARSGRRPSCRAPAASL